MLYLNPPYHIIDGVSVFADHADPRQFYYLPAVPHLSTTEDPQTHQRIPVIQLLRYTGSTSGAFLNFDVDLSVDPDILAALPGEIKRIFAVDGDPIIAPVVVDKGSVRLIALDAATPEPDAPPSDDTSPPQLVTKIDHAVSPSLYGDNRAVFSVQLDEVGARLFDDAMMGRLMPVGVIYELEFTALRPAYQVSVQADWSRVQKHFEEMSNSRVLFFSNEIDKAIDELHESQVITIEVTNFIPDGDASALISDPRKALDEVKEMVLQKFFTPSLNPPEHGKDGWDRATDVATQLSTLAVTGGWAGVGTFSYRKVDLTRVDDKVLNVQMSERTAVRRQIYPQAHMEGLTEVLRDANGNLTRDDFIRDVSLDDPFFTKRRVTARSVIDMNAEGVSEIGVRLDYAGTRQDLLLTPTKTEDTAEWPSVTQNGAVVADVQASYEVRFASVQTTERPASLQSSTSVVTGSAFPVAPHGDDSNPALYHLRTISLWADGFPWDRYPVVEVAFDYADPDRHIAQSDTVRLRTGDNTASWVQFVGDETKLEFTYRITYRAADNHDVVAEPVATSDDDIALRDPRSTRRTVRVVPAFGWDTVTTVFVDLSYVDEANDVRAEKSVVLSKDDHDDTIFTVQLADPDQRLVHYRVRLLLADNSLVEQPESMTLANEIFVRADFKGHRVVVVRPATVDFAAKNVREVRASFSYADVSNGINAAQSYSFTSASDVGYFEYDYVDTARGAYQVSSVTVFSDGFTSTKPMTAADADEFVVPVG